jgi:spore maturation protein CgeB
MGRRREDLNSVKITIFGLTISSSWGNGHATPYRAIVRALRQMGHEIHFFEKDVPWYHLRRDFAECEYCRLTFYSDWPEIRKYALQTMRESDVVLTASYLPDGQLISDEVLDLAQPLRVFYDLDTPVTLRNLEDGGVAYLRREQIPEFDLVLSFSGGPILRQLEQHYGARLARPLYGCVDPDIYHRVPSVPEFACDLSYMGTFAEDRQSKVEELFLGPASRYPEKEFVLAGSMYPWDWQWPSNVRRMEHVPPADHPAFYSSSRLTLNITRSEMARWGWCPSGRFFEASACGTPIVTDWWEGLDAFFDPIREVRVVASTEDIDSALNAPAAELQIQAANARQRTLDEHTGRVRAMQLLQYLEEARSASALKLETEAS